MKYTDRVYEESWCTDVPFMEEHTVARAETTLSQQQTTFGGGYHSPHLCIENSKVKSIYNNYLIIKSNNDQKWYTSSYTKSINFKRRRQDWIRAHMHMLIEKGFKAGTCFLLYTKRWRYRTGKAKNFKGGFICDFFNSQWARISDPEVGKPVLRMPCKWWELKAQK